MSLTKRVEAVEMAAARRDGEVCYKIVLTDVGETEEEARVRAGLTDWNGRIINVIFVSQADARL